MQISNTPSDQEKINDRETKQDTSIKIRDTLSGQEKKVDTAKKIRIYLCGVTVYDESHIGHARTIIVFDVLQRYLEGKEAQVELVQNFTDVDDKIIERANKEDATASEISERYIGNYFKDFDGLNVRRAAEYPKATKHMEEIIQFIKKLIEKDFAYPSKNGVYFSVSKFPEYGKLSKKKTDELLSGARVKVDEEKGNPLDFALWKFSDSKPVWDSPWGKGRPGWHIECSAMSLKYLGENFEIHGGGRDLIFPHHENEIAQSESCTGVRLAKIWMHVGMVTINGQKMSKSVGNVKSVKQILEDWGPNVTRLFCLSRHYSKPIDYCDELIRSNLVKWNQVRRVYYRLIQAEDSLPKKDVILDIHQQIHGKQETIKIDEVKKIIDAEKINFDSALSQDMNTHLALQAFYKIISFCLVSEDIMTRDAADHILPEIRQMMCILGLVLPKINPDEITKNNKLVRKRNEYRDAAKKDTQYYKEADKIRDELIGLNIETIDMPTKTVWMYKDDIKQDTTV